MKNPKALTIDPAVGEARHWRPAAYAKLLKVIKAEIAAGKKLIAQTMAVTNWKVGRYISDFVLEGKDRAGYGEYTYQKLAKDLDTNVNYLERLVRFSREFSISAARQKLDWTDYRTLLGLPDPSARRELARRALRENLNTRQIQKEVTRYKIDHKAPAVDQPVPKLTAERGKLFTYRSVQEKKPASSSSKDKGPVKKVRIDCGFNVWRTIALETPQKVSPDTIYTSVKTEDGNYRLRPAKNDPKELFTYQAEVERVVDADTLWVVIDCGFETEVRKKVRLRGIDAPELGTRLGRKAKRFVEKLLKPCPFIVVKTHKDQSDKYERYLVDVYLPSQDKKSLGPRQITPAFRFDPKGKNGGGMPGGSGPAAVAATGEYLNQRLLDEGLAQAYKK